MPGPSLEMILSKQLADCLSVPVFLVDAKGNLEFYNEQAELLIARKFEEAGPMPKEEWGTVFNTRDEMGNLIPPEENPLWISLVQKIPSFKKMWVQNLEGEEFKIHLTSYPIVGKDEVFSGAVAIFWRVDENE